MTMNGEMNGDEIVKKLHVNEDAALWYKEQLQLQDGDYLQFFPQVYGASVHPNYSLGIRRKSPHHMAIQTTTAGITFYFEDADAWFLDNHSMQVTLADDDIEFVYEKI